MVVPRLVGRDARFFLDDGRDFVELPAVDRQPVTMGLDLSSRPDMTATVTLPPRDGLTDWEDWFLYGDGTGRPLGLVANNVSPGKPATLPHPGHMTRQRRRAAARAAAKDRRK